MVVHITKENFEKEVVNSDIPVLIDFWASWCGPCQMMGPVFEETSKAFEGRVKFVKLNTEEFPQKAGEMGVSGIPCLILTKNGKELDRIVGFLPKAQLKESVEGML